MILLRFLMISLRFPDSGCRIPDFGFWNTSGNLGVGKSMIFIRNVRNSYDFVKIFYDFFKISGFRVPYSVFYILEYVRKSWGREINDFYKKYKEFL